MPRDLQTVIESLLAVLPESEAPVRARLAGLRETVTHTPPETIGNRWRDLEAVMVDLISPHFGQPRPPWLESAIAIWKGQ